MSSKEGKALIAEYGIEKVPTILIKGDAGAYPSLVKAWKSVGTVEQDGTYVFRKLEIIKKTYKDLATGEVVAP